MKNNINKSYKKNSDVALFDYSAQTSNSLITSVNNFEAAILEPNKKNVNRCTYNMQLLNTLPYVVATDNVPKGYEIKVDSTPIK